MKLKRELGLWRVTAYGIGIIVGAGIYALIGEAALLAGPSVWISFLVAALVASFTALSYAELSSMYPKAAAEYVYVKKAWASKPFAFLIGWLILLTGVLSAATVALGFGGYLSELTGFPLLPAALLLIVLLSFINFLGIRISADVNAFLTLVEVSGLLLIIWLGFQAFGARPVNYFEMSFGVEGLMAAAALIFFAYLGFEDIARVAEETRDPRRVVPKALLLAIGISTLLYVLTAVAAVTLADPKALGESPAPLAFAASHSLLGEKAFTLLSFFGLFATITTVLIILIATSRMFYGMAADGSLPRFLSKIHPRGTPHFAILVTGLLSFSLVFVGEIAIVAELTSLGLFITFAFVNASLIWLRFKYPYLHRPFKVPLNLKNFPLLPFLGLLTCSVMIFQFSPEILRWGLALVVAGLVAYELRKTKIE